MTMSLEVWKGILESPSSASRDRKGDGVTTMRRIVSVIVPTRQRPDLLRKALASIRAIEGPDLKFEILVGDNGHLPETGGIAAEFDCVYLSTARDGASPARNLGLAKASGEFIAFLDDDDEWTRDTIRPHIAIMDAEPDIAAVFGQIVYVKPDLEPVGQPWPAKWPGDDRLFVTMLSGGYFPQLGATVVRASVAKAIGLMDEKLFNGEDWDWQLRIARDRRIGFVDRPCVYSRIRPLGSFDDVQVLRAKYAAKIFRRHAVPNIKRWTSPWAFLRSYVGVTAHICEYFVWTAVDKGKDGDRRGARRAIYRAFRLNPIRATKMLRNPQFLGAIKTSVFLNRTAKMQNSA